MIISQTPLRITLGGGGSDLTDHGICVTAAINLHTYIAVNRNWANDYSLKYSEVERAYNPKHLKHPLLRECILATDTPPGTEITSMSDVLGGTGLGSSGTFTVGVLRALMPFDSLDAIADLACTIDIGKQDQYAATFGGLRRWEFYDGKVASEEIPVPSWFEHLHLYDTGLRRDAYATLASNRRPDTEFLHAQADHMVNVLQGDCPQRFGEALTKQWQAKLRAAPTEAHLHIDRLINQHLARGCLGAKLIGAGDGGMILTYDEHPTETAIRVTVDHDGTRIIVP